MLCIFEIEKYYFMVFFYLCIFYKIKELKNFYYIVYLIRIEIFIYEYSYYIR